MKITYNDNVKFDFQKKIFVYSIKFSDNEYTMIYKNKSLVDIQKIKWILYERIDKFFKHEINELKTSDLNFEYKKIAI